MRSATQIARGAAPLLLVFLLAISACGGSSEKADAPAESQQGVNEISQAPPVPDTTPPAQVDLAVRIAKAIQESPDRAASILAENGLTAEQWKSMMEDIAADSTLSKAYVAGMER